MNDYPYPGMGQQSTNVTRIKDSLKFSNDIATKYNEGATLRAGDSYTPHSIVRVGDVNNSDTGAVAQGSSAVVEQDLDLDSVVWMCPLPTDVLTTVFGITAREQVAITKEPDYEGRTAEAMNAFFAAKLLELGLSEQKHFHNTRWGKQVLL
jgi:hypothetical protein